MGHGADLLGPAVETDGRVVLDAEAELGGGPG